MSEKNKLKRIYFFWLCVILYVLINCVAAAAGENEEEIGTCLFQSTSKKRIALTFDDGPHYKFTPMILDSLKKHGAKATFFVIGDRIKYTPELLERMYNEGHEIGNHTFTHCELTSISPEKARIEISKANEAIYEVTKSSPIIIRPPLGARNKRTDNIIREAGLSIILWNIDTKDWTGINKNRIYDHVMQKASDGDIILMHDSYLQTAEAVDMIIETLTENDFMFVTVNELMTDKSEMEAGIVYYSQKRRYKY